MNPAIRAVLFDLDGTLVDTAPDLATALNTQRARRRLPPLALEAVRPYASHGTPGLLSVGFGIEARDPTFPILRLEYLGLYEDTGYRDSRLFERMDDVLDGIEERGLRWGVVTNKPARFTEPLLRKLGLLARAAVVISGDSTANAKPHPEPMLAACARLDLAPGECLYVGDAERDVEAAVAAGMPAVVARWGYLGESDRPETWGADALVDGPSDLLPLLSAGV